jgi:hypothetical protein
MNELWEASLQFPTVVFTIALGILLIYWLFVLVGLLDMGHGHADVGGDVGDVGADGGDASGHDGGDADGDAEGGFALWHGLGLGAVPITISVSIIVLVCWFGSLIAMHYVLPDAAWVRGVALPGVLLVSLPIAAVLVRPLAPVFRIREGTRHADLAGRICTVNTGHVDATFGDATVKEGGDVLIIQVRCDSGKLARGDKALVIEFDAERKAFLVEPSADMLPAVKGEGDKS